MTEPLDFSNVGGKKAAPPQQGAPRRPPGGTGSPKVRTAVVVLVIVALVAIVGFALFGRDGGETQESAAVKLSRFCEAATTFDGLAPGPGPGAGPVDTSAGAVGQLLQQLGDTVSRMQDDAPAAIRPDVVATVKALQEAAEGNPAGIRSASFQERRGRITGFREKNCAAAVDSGD